MTTLSKLSFQEKGHGLFKKEKKIHAQESMMKKKSWTHDGPSIQKKKKGVGHLKVQVFRKKKRER